MPYDLSTSTRQRGDLTRSRMGLWRRISDLIGTRRWVPVKVLTLHAWCCAVEGEGAAPDKGAQLIQRQRFLVSPAIHEALGCRL